MSFLTNPEVVEITDYSCKTTEPHVIKTYKREVHFDDYSGNSSENDFPHIEVILKRDNVSYVYTEFESPSSSLSGGSSTHAKITS